MCSLYVEYTSVIKIDGILKIEFDLRKAYDNSIHDYPAIQIHHLKNTS